MKDTNHWVAMKHASGRQGGPQCRKGQCLVQDSVGWWLQGAVEAVIEAAGRYIANASMGETTPEVRRYLRADDDGDEEGCHGERSLQCCCTQ
jgi:hypothetical protein